MKLEITGIEQKTSPGLRPEYVILIVYAAVVSIMVANHEPWFDEAQAWLMARDLSPVELFGRYLRYEGTPGLWHLLLMIPAKLHLPYFTMNLLALGIALTGVIIFVKYSPFPLYIKCLLPFSFFICYQYGVVARSYVLLPLLLFMIATVYPNRIKQVYRFIALLCLLSQTSLHGTLIAGVLFLAYLKDLVALWPKVSVKEHKAQWIAIGVFLANLGLTGSQLWPVADQAYCRGFNLDFSSFLNNCVVLLFDSLTTDSIRAVHYDVNPYLVILTFTAIISSLIWLYRRKTLSLYLAPVAVLMLLFSVKYVNVWHQGILFLVWIFALWVSFEKSTSRPEPILRNLVLASLVLVLAIQVVWSVKTGYLDYRGPYSASRDVAAYLKDKHLQSQEIFMTGFAAVAVLPYFDDNIFANFNHQQKPACWWWSDRVEFEWSLPLVRQRKPEWIVTTTKFDEKAPDVIPGYQIERKFLGYLYWKGRILEADSYILLRRTVNETNNKISH